MLVIARSDPKNAHPMQLEAAIVAWNSAVGAAIEHHSHVVEREL